MNSQVGIFAREYINPDSKLNIVWTPTDSIYFQQFISKMGHTLLSFDHLYFGKYNPQLIICNNKTLYYEKCRAISIQFHIPSIVIDHDKKSDIVDSAKLSTIDSSFPCSYKIALSEDISKSWGGNHHKILSYNASDKKNIEIWKNSIIQTSKMVFKYNG